MNFTIFVWVLLCFSIVCVSPNSGVTVETLQLPYEHLHTLDLSTDIEYIIDFVPNAEQAQFPSRVWIHSNGADILRPVLVTARQITGALTWQLPWVTSAGKTLNELEHTLCPAVVIDGSEISECVGDEEKFRGTILHISSTCEAPVTVSVRVSPVRDWHLPFQAETTVRVAEASPRSLLYTFQPDQENVRLIVSSDDDVCATISIQNYTCPLLEDESDVAQTGQRMTMMRSGGVQLSRIHYRVGFYVVMIVRSSDQLCTGETTAADDDWLWDQVVFGEREEETVSHPRAKTFHIRIEPALTRGQYAVATTVTTVVFLAFYMACAAFVMAQRCEPFRRLVAPMEPPDDIDTEEAGHIDGQTVTDVPDQAPPLRRRGSNATLDTSDNSDSDTESDRNSPDGTPRATAVLTPTTVSIAESTPDQEVALESNGQAVVEANGQTVLETVNGQVSFGDTTETSETRGSDNTHESGETHEPGETRESREMRESRETAATPEAGRGTPFGLPPQLRLAALSRHRAKVLRVRSDRYLWTLLTVAVFYALPVVQFVAAFQMLLNVSGSLDICYYNFLCAHPAGQVTDFNHVFSNLGYLLLGALFILQVHRRRRRRKVKPRKEEYGIPPHYGLLNALGAGMMVVALLSASYHICPNGLNFQFDTAFMYVLSVVMMVKIYQSRHPDINARAHATFGVLAVIIALGVWGVLGGGAFFWAMFTVVHLFTFLLLSLRIYYVGQFRLERETLQRAARGLAAMPKLGVRPLYRTRLLMLALANCFNWAYAIYGLWVQGADFASHLLTVLLGNTLLYMGFYLTMKLLHGERPRWYAWCFLAGAVAAWVPALYFFTSGSSSWSSTPAESRHRNHECRLLEFYDNHDLWHFLSAIALYLTFNTLLTWDDGLTLVKRTEIAVF